MYPISPAARDRLRTSHLALPRITITDSVGTVVPELESGTVSINGLNLVRTTATFTLSPSWWERAKRWPLEAARVEIAYGVGSLDTQSAVEYVPFGLLFVEKVARTVPASSVEVSCTDTMRLVEYTGFEVDFGYVAGTSTYTALSGLLQPTGLQPSPYNAYLYNPNVPTGWNIERSEERLKYVQTFADTLSVDVFTNRDKYWQTTVKSIAPAAPVWTIDASQTGVMIDASDERTGEHTKNVVVVFTEPTDGSLPVQVVVKDTDPNSPTYANGPFGYRLLRRSAGFLRDTNAMTQLANAVLYERLGLERDIRVTSTPCPHLDPNDWVDVVFPGEFPEPHRVAGLEVDLAGGPCKVDLISERVR